MRESGRTIVWADSMAEAIRHMPDSIDAWRNDIDEIDDQLLKLFNRRAHCAIEIGVIKRRLHLPMDVPEREAQVVARVVGRNEGPLDGEAIERLFDAVIAESRIAEQAMVGG